MNTSVYWIVAAAALTWISPAQAHHKTCPMDSVKSGDVCMDKYEASVWQVPDPTGANKSLVKKIRKGAVLDVAELAEKGAVQLGVGVDNYGACGDDGTGCTDVFAISVAGATPSADITWFQALQACVMAGKHLPTNAEWQRAVEGTPDPGPDNGTTDCNTNSGLAPVASGSRGDCQSSAGAFDMVGNLWEWTSDWVAKTTHETGWVGFSNDTMAFTGASETAEGPAAPRRGGGFGEASSAGPLALASMRVSLSSGIVGFRCARQ